MIRGPRPDKGAKSSRHVDVVSFLHRRIKEAEQAQIELSAKIYELESLYAAARAVSAEKQAKQKKRKRSMEDSASNANAPKRSREPALDLASQNVFTYLGLSMDGPGFLSVDCAGEHCLPCSMVRL